MAARLSRDSGRGQAGPGGGGLDACRCRAITLHASADWSPAQASGSGGGNAMLQRPEHVALRRPSLHSFTRAVRRRCQASPARDLTTAVYGTTFAERWPTACLRGNVDVDAHSATSGERVNGEKSGCGLVGSGALTDSFGEELSPEFVGGLPCLFVLVAAIGEACARVDYR